VTGSKADNILQKAEKALLNIRIGQIKGKLDHLNVQQGSLTQRVEEQLPVDKSTKVKDWISQVQVHEHLVTKGRQQGKFQRLVARQQPTTNEEDLTGSKCIEKWVRNCSDRILSDPELAVLAKGLNFAVAPSKVPVEDIITETESACRNLPKNKADDLRVKVRTTISKYNPGKHQNLSKEEIQAIQTLRKDKSICILPADKGRCAVVLNRSTYKEKCDQLLKDTKTYKKLKRDPTQIYKKQLIEVLHDLQKKGKVDKPTYHKIYPTTETPPKFYGLPKIHKKDNPLRPIVSSVDSITYTCARFVADILSPLVGKSEHHVKNSQEFAKVITDKTVQPDEKLVSYDVSALFTSVPVDKALEVIRERLVNDTTLSQRTSLCPEDIIRLLDVCVKCTYFVYDGVYYQQIHGAAMGSPVSPILCNLYMEDFETKALTTAPHPPEWWFRYVDDTHTKQKTEHTEEFLAHINSIDPHIQFTTEEETDGALAFLDTLSVKRPDGSLKVKVFRKPTHTDQYLLFDSNHPLDHKLGVVKTLHKRAHTIVTDPEDEQQEIQHVNEALKNCSYPDWAIKRAIKPRQPSQNRKNTTNTSGGYRKPAVAVPYVQGLAEPLRRIFAAADTPVYFKPRNTIRQLLVSAKDKTEKKDICGPVYHIQCEGNNSESCDETYIGESERTLRARFAEHRRPSSATSEVSNHIHRDCPGHKVDIANVQILTRDARWYQRGVREAIHIRKHQPSLNRDGGRHQLSHIWDSLILANTQSVSRD